ncbi:tRNA pseudouridine38-40 synthase [Roseivirga pacifica]|uniref:tRNA pseudouridine synthase A n=2 Tax=Roseivirga pacifica TaxID=1267423 RepID=A0A1I0R8S1_9BACT|nr:tRNA pseudouridine38-40 synthase [Roseivirga pacifica]SEW37126.1 tRNA pseudouridine38-40 synthase [Roseivirga pacifica]
MKKRYYYLIKVQYLGFRFHGWAKQPEVKTIHHMIDRTLNYVFGHSDFKTLGGSRTDAKVSANSFIFELFLKAPLADEASFLENFNLNLPADIRGLSIVKTDAEFNIIQTPKTKEYLYLFSFGQKAHPFSAPFVSTFPEQLNIDTMMKGAKLFEGEHEFRAYCKKPGEDTVTRRTIALCEIVPNTFYTANFFPSPSYALRISGKGFMRNQIRLIMGQLVRLGRNEVDLNFIAQSLTPAFGEHLSFVAPASGLILNEVNH